MYDMEAVCVKLDDGTLRNLDASLKEHNYTTRTDFIREAIRDKLRQFEKEEAIKKLEKYLGWSKTRTSDEKLHKIRDEVFREMAKKHGIKLD